MNQYKLFLPGPPLYEQLLIVFDTVGQTLLFLMYRKTTSAEGSVH